jgi:hypothetical protein
VKEGSAVPSLRFGVHEWKGGVLTVPGAMLGFQQTTPPPGTTNPTKPSVLHLNLFFTSQVQIDSDSHSHSQFDSAPKSSISSPSGKMRLLTPPIRSGPDAQPQNGPAKIPSPWRRSPGIQARDPQFKSNQTSRSDQLFVEASGKQDAFISALTLAGQWSELG